MSSDAEGAGLEALLNEAWVENRAEVVTRVTILREVLASARAGRLEGPARQEADSLAHKLAGVLGTFGLRDASRAALRIESMLASNAELSTDKFADYEAALATIGEGIAKRDKSSGK